MMSAAEFKQIRKVIENYFARYRFYQMIDCDPRGPFLHSTKEEMQGFCKRIDQAVSQLSEQEQLIIKERYLDWAEFDYLKDYEMLERFDPPISSQTYSRIRRRAFIKISSILGLKGGDIYETL